MTFSENYQIRTEESPELTEKRNRIEAMLQHMLLMQDKSNRSLYPDWQERELRYVTATVIEAAELIDHLDWKWWKSKESNLGQAQMEAVDIWHFLLSRLILQDPGLLYDTRDKVPEGELAAFFRASYMRRYISVKLLRAPAVESDLVVEKVIKATESFISTTLAEAYVAADSVPSFARILSYLGMSFEQLYKKYIGKNLLNSFRWANGYKEGIYVKDWGGEEDNEFLTRTLEGTDLIGPELEQYISSSLERRYSIVKEFAEIWDTYSTPY